LIVASSTGNAEAPSNAQKLEKIIQKAKSYVSLIYTNFNLYNSLKKVSLNIRNEALDNAFKKDLKDVRFSLLGLGSTSYADFCGFAKAIHYFLKQVNLKEIYKFSMADEMHNEENSCFEWLRETFKVILLI
jgi:sulfite reductase alpha subunit-like flavoprotein